MVVRQNSRRLWKVTCQHRIDEQWFSPASHGINTLDQENTNTSLSCLHFTILMKILSSDTRRRREHLQPRSCSDYINKRLRSHNTTTWSLSLHPTTTDHNSFLKRLYHQGTFTRYVQVVQYQSADQRSTAHAVVDPAQFDHNPIFSHSLFPFVARRLPFLSEHGHGAFHIQRKIVCAVNLGPVTTKRLYIVLLLDLENNTVLSTSYIPTSYLPTLCATHIRQIHSLENIFLEWLKEEQQQMNRLLLRWLMENIWHLIYNNQLLN